MLTDTQIRAAKKAEAGYRLTDGDGLFLFVTPTGGKVWRMRYYIGKRERVVSLGAYPAVGLSDARAARDEMRRTLAAGRDPAVARKVDQARSTEQQANRFDKVARDWFAISKVMWVERHAEDVIHSLEEWAFPDLGSLPLHEITPPVVLACLRKIEGRGAIETARRVRQRISRVFVFAIASGIAENDPAAIIEKAMAPLPRKGKQPAVKTLDGARKVLADCMAEQAHPVTKLALRLLALTVVRPGTLAGTPWHEFDEIADEDPQWHVPAERMKLRLAHKEDETKDHFVPLAPQALETIEALRALTGRGPLVFPNGRNAHKPMSENAMGYLLNRAGYHHRHVPHGWRSTFSTIMNEKYPADRQVIDLMLAHAPRNKVEAAYNRAAHMARRRELAIEWASMITDGLPPAMEMLRGPRRQGLRPRL